MTGEDALVLAKGVAIGMMVAAPVGPVNVLCARRALAHGWRAGMASGLGAAAADTLFAAAATLGLSYATGFVATHRVAIVLAGGLFLLAYGWRTLRAAPPPPGEGRDAAGLAGDFASAFVLTLANPITVFSFAGSFVALAVPVDQRVDARDALLVGGVMLGATCWWTLLVSAASRLRERFTRTGLAIANRVAGIVIVAFGVAALAGLALEATRGGG